MKRLGLIIILSLVLCFMVFPSAQAEITGPHNISHAKGVCANCHIPHKAKGNRIWARNLSEKFGGVRQLCNTCHDGTFSSGINPGDPGSPGIESGILTVFGSRYESHVMHGAANITKDEWLGTYDAESFPLDPNDRDSVPGHPDEWDKISGAGFYCGSCHNPHVQPEGYEENGDYLRTKNGDVGEPENRSPFCKECHDPVETGNSHLESNNCGACHHPHEGYERARTGMTEDELKIARLIFKAEVVITARFIAQPNVPDITEDPNDRTFISSGFCYGCHQARHILGPSDPNNNFWREAGAAPIYGDQINGIDNDTQRRNHHPMGTQARLVGSVFLRAPGTEATKYLNKNGELTCISCHADLHGETQGKDYDQSKENNFLRWDFTNDNAEFCIECHSDKAMSNNQIIYDEKHFWDTNSPITREIYNPTATGGNYEKTTSCKQCMFCHFIHDGEERTNEGTPGAIRADIDTLMRIGPKNLAWGDRSTDTDLYDYEDMCFGCHGEESIVSRTDFGLNALLNPDSFFTHRFASPPDPNSPTFQNIVPGGLFPLSDGPDPAIVTIDDYGTQAGNIYCGSCHNVHTQYNTSSPYLNSGQSPYVANGFCEACHDDSEGNFVRRSHPIAKGPNDDPILGTPTVGIFPAEFTKWKTSSPGSGEPGGVVTDEGEVICLTCHNTHAAVTSWDGKTPADETINFHGQLLVKDNFVESWPVGGGEFCKDCHKLAGENNIYPEEGGHEENFEGTETDDGTGRELSICHSCHKPHYSLGPKLWSRPGYFEGPFTGIRQLCYTCHNPDDTILDEKTGLENVFKIKEGEYDIRIDPNDPNIPMDHVMHAAASIPAINPVPGLIIPVDPNDDDTFPFPDEYRKGGEFYCGSCHNPHDQPTQGGSYLRSADGDTGSMGDRIRFCDDCHPDAHGGSANECLTCHSVHLGAVLPRENEQEARWILINRVRRTSFLALPNVQSLSEDPNDLQNTDSPFCYGCHGPEGSKNWSQDADVRPIYGDDALASSKEHHPMGNQATKDSLRASIPIGQNYYNAAGELTCKSCHDDIHGPGPFANDAQKAKDNFFLRWEFNNAQIRDQETFCIACHTNKSASNLAGEHLVSVNDSPNGRGGCMFCHFIHDGEERQSDLNLIPNNGIRADVDALMRQSAISLIWKVGDIVCSDDSCIDVIDVDPYDYEDMCYGCHGDPNIVEGAGVAGALLQPATYFTHRYTCAPDPNSPTTAKIKTGGIYPLSDGPGLMTLNDYGTKTDHIYCGSCHNVHDGRITPYLNHAEGDINLAVDNGFCEACHDESHDGSGEFVQMSHPVNVGPNPPATVASWDPNYYQGGSGEPFGITGDGGGSQGTVICLTCHNVHACTTSYNGMVLGDDDKTHGFLLIKDNKSTPEGSDMCQDCHLF